jgi:hypothetical protein
VKDEIDLAPGVRAEEVEARRLRLPRGPAKHLVEDGRFEEGAGGRVPLFGEEAGEGGVRPVELFTSRAVTVGRSGRRRTTPDRSSALGEGA